MGQTQDFPFDIEDVSELLRLRIRRRCTDGVYTDCPFCGDNRGKMKINYAQNVWRCNYCGESGGMLKLYAKAKGITTSEAYREICDAIQNGVCFPISSPLNMKKEKHRKIPQSARAENPVIHQTFTGLLGLLKLSGRHREHLRQAGLQKHAAILSVRETGKPADCPGLYGGGRSGILPERRQVDSKFLYDNRRFFNSCTRR